MIDNCKLPDIILASGSPRRREILAGLGFDFCIECCEVDETIAPGSDPADVVRELSRQKGQIIAERHRNALVISADTIVVLGDQILGKPETKAEAAQMLARLSGQQHLVYTGYALQHMASARGCLLDYEVSKVQFYELSPEQIQHYIASGESMDKAGAYGIQRIGALLVKGIEGCYFNVMGLPVAKLYRSLLEFQLHN